MHLRTGVLTVAWVALGACGGTSGGAGADAGVSAGYLIQMHNLEFLPADLAVPPGTTITVRNLDGTEHSATSESARDAITPGGVGGVQFDTGLFSGGDKTIDVPSTAAAGTVVPYYCRVHGKAMQAQLTIDPNATPNAAPLTSSPGGRGGTYSPR